MGREVIVMVSIWHYVYWNVYITSIKLSSEDTSLHTVLCNRLEAIQMNNIAFDRARYCQRATLSVDDIIIDNLSTSYFQSMQCSNLNSPLV